jgi:hypothetical protein
MSLSNSWENKFIIMGTAEIGSSDLDPRTHNLELTGRGRCFECEL